MFFNEIIIGKLILQSLQFLQFNAHEIYDNDGCRNSMKENNERLQRIGIGIYPNSAKLNHQCYAATMR